MTGEGREIMGRNNSSVIITKNFNFEFAYFDDIYC